MQILCLVTTTDARVSTGQFVNKPSQTYDKALGKDKGILTNHDSCSFHKESIHKYLTLKESIRNPKCTLSYQISERHRELFQQNKHAIMCMIQTIILRGQRNISLRCHRYDATGESDRGNFITLLKFLGEHDEVLSKHLEESKKNVTYRSKTIQNELIDIIAQYIRKFIRKNMREDGDYFSLIVHEVTDHHVNKEIATLCFRFVTTVQQIMKHK